MALGLVFLVAKNSLHRAWQLLIFGDFGLYINFISNARQLHGELHIGVDVTEPAKEDGNAIFINRVCDTYVHTRQQRRHAALNNF